MFKFIIMQTRIARSTQIICSTSLVFREMQIKITVRYDFMHIRFVNIQKFYKIFKWWSKLSIFPSLRSSPKATLETNRRTTNTTFDETKWYWIPTHKICGRTAKSSKDEAIEAGRGAGMQAMPELREFRVYITGCGTHPELQSQNKEWCAWACGRNFPGIGLVMRNIGGSAD